MSRALQHVGRTAVALVALVGAAACGTAESRARENPDASELNRRSGTFEKTVAARDSVERLGGAVARWMLPGKLHEISGLALTEDGRLLGHGDARGHVFEIDYRRGVVVKEFTLARDGQTVKADFEGITVANGTVYLLASDGSLYEFKEGRDGDQVAFTRYDPGLQAACEFEGLAYDKAINSLLLACKKVHDKSRKDSLVVFRWRLAGDSASRLSHFTVPLVLAVGANGWDGLHPSDITVEPVHHNYVIIASREHAMVELTPSGAVIFSRPLPGEHPQAEGVAITTDSLLIISDEAGSSKQNAGTHPNRAAADSVPRPAVISVYRWP